MIDVPDILLIFDLYYEVNDRGRVDLKLPYARKREPGYQPLFYLICTFVVGHSHTVYSHGFPSDFILAITTIHKAAYYLLADAFYNALAYRLRHCRLPALISFTQISLHAPAMLIDIIELLYVISCRHCRHLSRIWWYYFKSCYWAYIHDFAILVSRASYCLHMPAFDMLYLLIYNMGANECISIIFDAHSMHAMK